jgi:hypothetical protein
LAGAQKKKSTSRVWDWGRRGRVPTNVRRPFIASGQV